VINFSTGVAVDTIGMGVETATSTEGTEAAGAAGDAQGAQGAESAESAQGAESAGGKPTPDELGIDPARLAWQRSGEGDGSIEIAFPVSAGWTRGDWVMMRVAGDPDHRILVFDRNEWVCFLDGVRNGEFDDATDLGKSDS
jgi:hypothetical protein